MADSGTESTVMSARERDAETPSSTAGTSDQDRKDESDSSSTAPRPAGQAAAAADTKVIYHIDSQETPYRVKVPGRAGEITLLAFKTALNRPGSSFKYFFKSVDDDFGVVKEEVEEDSAVLPSHEGRIVAWLVTSDSHSDTGNGPSELSDQGANAAGGSTSDLSVSSMRKQPRQPYSRRRQQGSDSNIDRDGENKAGSSHSEDDSSRAGRGSHRSQNYTSYRRHEEGSGSGGKKLSQDELHGSAGRRHSSSRRRYDKESGTDVTESMTEASSVLSSDFDTTSYFESDCSSRVSSVDSQSIRSIQKHRRRRKKHKMPRYASFSSVTESTVESLNIITVTLDMEPINFLGISIVGQSNSNGDGGIFVGSVMKGGAIDADGRIGPGDMILQVNDVNLENMSNDDAVRVLRDVVRRPGPITLTAAKCFATGPQELLHGIDTRAEPIQPIDPSAWVAHTEAIRAMYGSYASPTMSTITSTGSSSMTSSLPESERPALPEGVMRLPADTPMESVARHMAAPTSGLDIRDRMWLKIRIPKSFIGSDVVDWLYGRLDGFTERRQARKYASHMLKAGLFKHTVNKITFSEQCYYVFSKDICSEFSNLHMKGDGDVDTLTPLPEHGEPWMPGIPRPMGGDPFLDGRSLSFAQHTQSHHRHQHYGSGSGSGSSPYASISGVSPPTSVATYTNGRHSSSGGSGHSHSPSASTISRASRTTTNTATNTSFKHSPYTKGGIGTDDTLSIASSMDKDRLSRIAAKLRRGSQTSLNMINTAQEYARQGGDTASIRSMALSDMTSVSQQIPNRLGAMSASLTNSQQSFKAAMTQPCEFFVDLM